MKVCEAINILNRDVQMNEILQHEELKTSTGGKMKTLRPTMDCEFEFDHLDDNQIGSVQVGVDLLARI